MEEDLLLMCVIAVVFALASLLGSCAWYAKRQSVSYKTALLVLWQEGIVAGVAAGVRSVLPTAKAVWSHTKRLARAVWDYLKPLQGKHQFTPALYEALYCAVKEYIYTPFQPVITVRYTPYPSAVYVAFYTKSTITPEVTAEVVWHVQAAFQEYLSCYGLTFDYTAVPFVQDNHIEVWLYYAETPAEYPAYRTTCHQAMLMKADPQSRPLLESDVLPSSKLVLGYRYEPWRDSGQLVPVIWDVATSPSILIAGPSGSGKTLFAKMLLERLLLAGAEVTICDFKGFGDFRGFVKDYAIGSECDAMLAKYCADFERIRLQGVPDGKHHVLIFDELGSFVASKSKKEAEEFMRMLSNVIFMGRIFSWSVIWLSQRFDHQTLPVGLREQCSIKVHMGTTISPQSAGMLFPHAEITSGHLDPYCGFYSTPKTDCDVIITPKIDVPALDRRLKALGKSNGT